MMKPCSITTALFAAVALACASSDSRSPAADSPGVAESQAAWSQAAWSEALETAENLIWEPRTGAWSIQIQIQRLEAEVGLRLTFPWPGEQSEGLYWASGVEYEEGESSRLTPAAEAAVTGLRALLAEEEPVGSNVERAEALRDRVRRAERFIDQVQEWRRGAERGDVAVNLPLSLAALTDEERSADSERLGRILGTFLKQRLAILESNAEAARAQLLTAQDELSLRASELDAALSREMERGRQTLEQAEARLEEAQSELLRARGQEEQPELASSTAIARETASFVFANLNAELDARRVEFIDQLEPSIRQVLLAQAKQPAVPVMVGDPHQYGFAPLRRLRAGGAGQPDSDGEPDPLRESESAWEHVANRARVFLRDGEFRVIDVQVGDLAAEAGVRYLEQMRAVRTALAAAAVTRAESQAERLQAIEALKVRRITLQKAERFHVDALAQVARARQR